MIEWVTENGLGAVTVVTAKALLALWVRTDGATSVGPALKSYDGAGTAGWDSTDATALNAFSNWWNSTGHAPAVTTASGVGQLALDDAHSAALEQWKKLRDTAVAAGALVEHGCQQGYVWSQSEDQCVAEDRVAGMGAGGGAGSNTGLWVVAGLALAVAVVTLIVSASRIGAVQEAA